MIQEGVWKEKQTIKSFQMGPNFQMNISTISELLQEAGGNHSNFNEFGIKEMIATGRIWVLSRLKVEAEKLPVWGDEVTVETWVKSAEGVTSLRDFIIRNTAGEVILRGSSLWYAVDIKKRRPTSLEDMAKKVTIRSDLSAIDRDSLEKLPLPKHVDYVDEVKVKYSDLDPALHANNVKYLSWALNSYPIAFHKAHQFKGFEINFLAETLYGQSLEVETEEKQVASDVYMTTVIKHKDTGKPGCLIRTTWQQVAEYERQAEEATAEALL
ncbi:acyl-ACP thioesterase domain-containing protein [Limibacter armeniacum]|uniref:acyl-[acyl-carrier-protein] thioesterase n=1 Tax=Limibacter armeniacum TaxID=466084 RepID=UPI002FE5C72F